MKHVLMILLGALLAQTAAASVPARTHLGTPEQQQNAREWNRNRLSTFDLNPEAAGRWPVMRPFSEVEQTGFVAISGDNDFELPQLRLAIAKNLPAGVTLVVYVTRSSQVANLKKALSPFLGDDRLKFLTISMPADGDPIWARDSLPFPVYMQPSGGTTAPTFGLVASIYPQDFDPNAAVAKALGLQSVSTGEYFRGGNLLFDLDGNCFAEDVNEVADLPNAENFLKQYFGCKTVTLPRQVGGIGDIDERLKIIDNKTILTDDDTFAKLFQGRGYDVHRIPSTGSNMETYMNTLMVNGTIFVPQMGIPADKDALAAYAAVGLKPVGVMTKSLADEGEGNIHCVTMNYPAGTFVASPEGGDFVKFAVSPR